MSRFSRGGSACCSDPVKSRLPCAHIAQTHFWAQEDEATAAVINAGELLVPWMGDESALVDRFDARLLLDSIPAPCAGRSGVGGVVGGVGHAAGIVVHEAQVSDTEALAALLQHERWRSLPDKQDGGEFSDSDSADGACEAGGRRGRWARLLM